MKQLKKENGNGLVQIVAIEELLGVNGFWNQSYNNHGALMIHCCCNEYAWKNFGQETKPLALRENSYCLHVVNKIEVKVNERTMVSRCNVGT